MLAIVPMSVCVCASMDSALDAQCAPGTGARERTLEATLASLVMRSETGEATTSAWGHT